MSTFRGSLYDTFKDRRYAALFLLSLVALALSPVLVPIMAGFGLARAWSAFQMARADRRNRLRYPPLSRDEVRVARSKLQNGMKPLGRPEPRVPDTNLRY